MANYTNIISQAIDDFNNIQNALNAKDSSMAATSSSYALTNTFADFIKKKLTAPSGTLTIDSSMLGNSSNDGYFTYEGIAYNKDVDYKSYSAIKIPQGTLGSGDSLTITGTNTQDIISGTGYNLSGIITATGTSAPATGYYIAVTSNSTGSDKSGIVSITKAGWINDGSATISTNYESSAVTKYYTIRTANYTDSKFNSGYVGNVAAIANNSSSIKPYTGTVEPGAVTISSGKTSVSSGKTYKNITSSFMSSNALNIASTEPTDSSYYLVLKGNVAAGSKTDTNAIKGNAKGHVSTAGYAHTGLTFDTPLQATATLNSTSKSSSDLYVKVPTASINDSGTFTAGWAPTKGTAKGAGSLTGTSATVSHSGTTVTFKQSITNTPVVSEGYIKSGTGVSCAISLSATEANLLAGNIRSGISIFGVTGTYLAPSVDDSAGTNTGSELRYVKVTTDSEHSTSEHFHSSHMLKGAAAYVDNNIVYGVMNDFSKSTSATNAYGAKGDGTILTPKSISVSGNSVTFTSGSTGYIETDITTFTGTVGETLPNYEISKKTDIITPSTDKLISSVEYTVKPGGYGVSGSVSITENKTAPTAYGKSILCYADSKLGGSSPRTDYVTVTAKGSAKATITSGGWLDADSTGKSDNSLNNTKYIPAILGSSLSLTITNNTNGATVVGNRYLIGDAKVYAQTHAKSVGSLTVETVTTSPTADKGKAKTATDASSGYVTVTVNESATTVTTPGWINSGDIISARPATAKIPAAVSPTINVTVSGTPKTFSTMSTFNTDTGAVTKAYSGNNATATISVNKNNTTETYKDKYIVNGITTTASGSVNATVGDNITGSNVDSALESLYKRMLGKTYTVVDVIE